MLRSVQALLEAGRSIGEIARLKRKALLSQPANADSEVRTASPPTGLTAFHPHTIFSTKPEPLGLKLRSELGRCCATVVEAAIRINGVKLDRALDYAFAIVSPDLVISQIIEPAAHIIGERWEAGHCGIGGEHLATSVFLYRLRKLIEMTNANARSDAPLVVCSCFPDEQHELGVLICTYYLARSGLRVIYLGQSLPFEDLEHACTVLSPAAVYLSVTRPSALRMQKSRLLSVLKRHAAQISFFIGGQGVTTTDDAITNAGAILWRQTRLVEKNGSTSRANGAGRHARSSRAISYTAKVKTRGLLLARK